MPRAKRREREIQRTREDILEAAARVFSFVGFAGATMHEIAREAGYTAPSLYTYFESKEALLIELFERFLQEVLEVYERPIPHSLNLEQSLELLVYATMELCDKRRDALIAFVSVATSGTLPVELQGINHGEKIGMSMVISRLTLWLDERRQPGELGSLSTDEAAYLLYGILSGLVTRWEHQGRNGHLVDLVPRALSVFFHGIRSLE